MTHRVTTLAVLLVTVVTLGSVGLSTPAVATTKRAAEQFTPIVMSVITKPSWFRGADGRVNLVYELQLLNAFPVDVAPHQRGNLHNDA